jgi:hypothetical protein
LQLHTAMLFREESAPPAEKIPGNKPMTRDNYIATAYFRRIITLLNKKSIKRLAGLNTGL